ncbi:MAG: peptidase C39 family protein [Verrucomicrobia bacterium]|jgi:hypothetical protein|nr:peptidase C39 family protein [Verrucomicrobiota bacterium]
MLTNWKFETSHATLTSMLLWLTSLSAVHGDDNHQYVAWTQPQFSSGVHRGGSSFYQYHLPIPLPEFDLKELIPSWNIMLEPGDHLDVFIRASFDSGESHSFHLGRWASGGQSIEKEGGRTSINDQNNDLGVVYTDTLVFKKSPVRCLANLQVLKNGSDNWSESLDFFGVCLSGERSLDMPIQANQPIEQIMLDVPRLCQRDYIGGGVWCSPTSVAMILNYWSLKLSRPELRYTVPEAASFTYDPGWSGTGNWAFNIAFAGEHSGIRAFVTRMNHLDELKSLLKNGLPIATSVSYDLLKGKPTKGSNDGHLVVVIGFNQNGDPVVNDPAACPDVTVTYPLDHFTKAWQSSRQTVYVIYPSERVLPAELQIQWPKTR